CAVGLVRIEDGRIVEKVSKLIRPPRDSFKYTSIHGMSWIDVVDKPDFGEVWHEVQNMRQGIETYVAHYAAFDKRVLDSCIGRYGLKRDMIPFLCTARIARQVWNLNPASLPNVCRILNIELDHHDPLSDAVASAKILIAACKSYQTSGRTYVGK
ncbi:MAG: exonuclease, partial [Candidatus Aegiribacteria sp.]|nr:exonuclease [Candidatus Aegiribacteria sp.]